MVAAGGNGGSDNQDKAGAAGSTGQYERGYDAGNTESYALASTYDAGVGGHGGAGTSAGKGGAATVMFDGQTGAVGNATSQVSGWNVAALPGTGLTFTIHSRAGTGGNGGDGGGGFAEHRVDYYNGAADSHTATDTFGDGGDAGAGGRSGNATARFSGNTIAAAGISLDIGANLVAAGLGGTGGVSLLPGEPVGGDITYVGHAPGANGAAGYCARRVSSGYEAEAIRNRLIARAGCSAQTGCMTSRQTSPVGGSASGRLRVG